MRPRTGPYRRGVDLAPEYRNCDACRLRVKRSAGRYVPLSRLRQIWCCARCADAREAGQKVAA